MATYTDTDADTTPQRGRVGEGVGARRGACASAALRTPRCAGRTREVGARAQERNYLWQRLVFDLASGAGGAAAWLSRWTSEQGVARPPRRVLH